MINNEDIAISTPIYKQLIDKSSEFSKLANVHEKIMAVEHILSPVGNCPTDINDSSTRYGKWMEIQIRKKDHSICGYNTNLFQLETTRITATDNMKSFHIFHMVFETFTKKELIDIMCLLDNKEEYKIMEKDPYSLPSIDYKSMREKFDTSLKLFKFTQTEIISIYKMVG